MTYKKFLWLILLLSSFLVFFQTNVFGVTKTAINSSSGSISSVFQTPSETIESGQSNEEKATESAENGELPQTQEEAVKSSVSSSVSNDYTEAVETSSTGANFIRDLTYTNYKDDLKYFTSKVYFKGEFFGFSSETNYLINSFVQAIFWINKLFFTLFANAYEAISNFGTVDSAITTVIDSSADIFNALATGEVIAVIGGITATYAIVMFALGKGSFFKVLIQFFLVYAVTLGLFSKAPTGDYYLTRFYNNTTSVFNNLATSVSGATQTYNSEGSVLDSYFQKAIWQPYAYMNADKTDTPVDGSSLELNLSDDQLKGLLGYEQGNGSFMVGEKEIQDITNEDDIQVQNLTNNWGEKFSYALGSVVNTFVMGLAIDFFGLMSFALKALLMVLFGFSWFYLLIALISQYTATLINFWKRIIIFSGLAGFMTFISSMFLYLYNVIENAIMSFTSNYLLTVFLKLAILFLVYRFRAQIIGVITGDRLNLTSMGSHMRSRFSDYRHKTSHNLQPDKGNENFSKMALAKASLKGVGNRSIKTVGQKGVNLSRQFKANRMAKRNGVSPKQALSYINAQSDFKKAKRQEAKRQLTNSINRTKAGIFNLASNGVKDDKVRENLLNRSQKNKDSVTVNNALQKANIRSQGHKERIERIKMRQDNKQSQMIQNQTLKDNIVKTSKKTGTTPKNAYKQYSREQRIEKRSTPVSNRFRENRVNRQIKPKIKQARTQEV